MTPILGMDSVPRFIDRRYFGNRPDWDEFGRAFRSLPIGQIRVSQKVTVGGLMLRDVITISGYRVGDADAFLAPGA